MFQFLKIKLEQNVRILFYVSFLYTCNNKLKISRVLFERELFLIKYHTDLILVECEFFFHFILLYILTVCIKSNLRFVCFFLIFSSLTPPTFTSAAGSVGC